MRKTFFLFFSLLTFTAFAQGKRPVITGQKALATDEEQPITIRLTDLYVTDSDNIFYPWGFTLTVYEGTDYTLSNNTVTPATNFNGVLSVSVSVNDGKHESEKYNVQITVNPINDAPTITGQAELSVLGNTSLTIAFSHLTVNDPDNTYPNGFTLSVSGGANYSVSGTTITPMANFTGDLTVPVSVSDGSLTSPLYNLKVTVVPPNIPPVITGQAPLATAKATAITISLSNLSVTDPDNTYPDQFTLLISPGSNYTVQGNVVMPTAEFVGVLDVSVMVNDGTSNSAPFQLKIEVTDKLLITGQLPLEVMENSSLTVQLTDLKVSDPSKTYPTGFSLQISGGENYTVSNQTVTPAKNFNGNLSVTVKVSKGNESSEPYSLVIVVKPVNNAPEILNLETEPLRFVVGGEPMPVTKTLEIRDADDETLELAEIGFLQPGYQAGNDVLIFENLSNIRGVFDPVAGILSLIGKATLAEYQEALRSIKYNYVNAESNPVMPKFVYFKLNDGKNVSETKQREIRLNDEIELDIPNGFTPNNDFANDTWKITALKNSDRFQTATVRVFDKQGRLVHESVGLEKAWDGKQNGETLPADTYYYTIDLNITDDKKNIKGIVTILH